VEPLITPQELLPHLADPGWVIVDCTFDLADANLGRSEYENGHIPGAVYASLDRDLSARPDGTNGRHPLPAPDDLAQVFSGLGIDDRSLVVAYDRNGSPYAARLWWSIRYLGGTCRVLDGGYEAWRQAGYPVRQGDETRPPGHFAPVVDRQMLATAHQVATGLGREVLLDARAPERYRGDEEPYDRVGGHIPGAHNFYWHDNLDEDGRFKAAATLRDRYRQTFGGRPTSAVIAYCGSGVTGCHLLLGMAHSGIEGGRLYAGSWSEWCSDPSRPVAVGDEILDVGTA
jgi:thiosulfate/3-mercaptopyruvate sulfurtransferase